MTATKPKGMPLSKWMLAILASLIVAFCLSLAMGASAAYATDEGHSMAGGDVSASAEPADAVTAPAEQTSAPVSSQDVTDGQANAPSPSASSDDAGAANLGAASGAAYPGDDGTSDVFIGLAPDAVDTSSSYRDSATNAVYVNLQSEVGKGVFLNVAVDYMRIGQEVHDARGVDVPAPFALPNGNVGTYTVASPAQGFMYTWYTTEPSLGQGTYYSDPSTNPALMGGGSGEVSSFQQYGVNLDNFKSEHTIAWDASAGRFRASVPHVYDSDGAQTTIQLPDRDSTGPTDSGRYMLSPLYFETPGMRTIAVQLTYMQECRAVYGGSELVGYVLHASNPVIFRIDVASALTANMIVAAQDQSGNGVDISTNDYFVELEKCCTDVPDGDEVIHEWLPFAFCNMRNKPCTYTFTTPGYYRLTVTHKDGLYQKYVELFKIMADDVSSASTSADEAIHKMIILNTGSTNQFTITFYDEDGSTVLMAGAQYNEGTVAENILAPSTPMKAATDKYKYVFKEWRAEVVGAGELDSWGVIYNHLYPVTCDTNYIAVYRAIPLVNDAGQTIVYASGGLFSNNAKPAGVLSYELTSAPLSEAEKSSVVQSHEGAIASDTVLGMVQVDLKQHNDDASNSVTDVTEHEGLDGMKLKFNMQESGIDASDGDELRILQIHRKDAQSPEEIIEHKATVANGEVEITLNGKLSTFIFLKANASSSGPAISYQKGTVNADNTVTFTTATTSNYTVIQSDSGLEVVQWGTSGQDSWYYLYENAKIDGRIKINGTVHLILGDGATLTTPMGFTVDAGDALIIYGQAAGTGSLMANATGDAAVIGNYWMSESESTPSGTVEIHGGNIMLTSDNNSGCAAIGGSFNKSGGTVVVYGGYLRATGGPNSAAIGGGNGNEATNGGSFTMYGGTVRVEGGPNLYGAGAGAAIGGNGKGGGGTVAIYGGELFAKGGDATSKRCALDGTVIIGPNVQVLASDTGYNTDVAPITSNFTGYKFIKTENKASQNSYTITWMTADGTVLKIDTGVTPGTVPSFGATAPTMPSDGHSTYTFKGWTPTVVAAAGDATYTAVFDATPVMHVVSFNANGHGTAPAAQSIADGGKAAKPADPIDSDHMFNGWYREAACTNAWDFAVDTVVASITLFAKWVANTPTPATPGTLTPSAHVDPGAAVSGASIGNAPNDLLQSNVFTNSEQQQIAAGTNAGMWISVKAPSGAAQNTDEVVKAAASLLGSASSTIISADIELYKQVGSGAAVQVTDAGIDVIVTLAIPATDLPSDPEKRAWCVVREHEGKLEALAATFNAANNTITFFTSKFSTFSVAAANLSSSESSEGTSGGETSNAGTSDEGSGSEGTSSGGTSSGGASGAGMSSEVSSGAGTSGEKSGSSTSEAVSNVTAAKGSAGSFAAAEGSAAAKSETQGVSYQIAGNTSISGSKNVPTTGDAPETSDSLGMSALALTVLAGFAAAVGAISRRRRQN